MSNTLLEGLKGDIEGTRLKARILCFLGLFGHPLYYFLWDHIFPQYYEDFTFRLILWLSLLAWFIFDRYLKYKNYIIFYTYFTVIFSLPCFFFYMFLSNGGSGIWLGSLISAVFFTALVVNTITFLPVIGLGFASGAIAFSVFSTNSLNTYNLLETVPVIAFAVIGGALIKHLEDRWIQTNRRTAVEPARLIAHELRTPLLGIRLDLERLETLCQVTPDKVDLKSWEHCRTVAERLTRHVIRASHTLDTLLQNVRQETVDTSSFTPLDIGDILRDALARYPFCPQDREKIHIDMHGSFTFLGDPFLMAQVFMNLIKNALTATERCPEGQVRIFISTEQDQGVVVVSDNGCGMQPVQLQRVFDGYHSNTTSGTGLGLLFCRRVTEMLKGSITCISEPGSGSAFTIRLPVWKGKHDEPVSTGNPNSSPMCNSSSG